MEIAYYHDMTMIRLQFREILLLPSAQAFDGRFKDALVGVAEPGFSKLYKSDHLRFHTQALDDTPHVETLNLQPYIPLKGPLRPMLCLAKSFV